MGLYDLQVYELLRAKLGEKEAKELATRISGKPHRAPPEQQHYLATKEDIAMLKEDIVNARIEVLRWIIVLWITVILALLGLYV
jgi:hypothetical protein